jgi:hypothetical protein
MSKKWAKNAIFSLFFDKYLAISELVLKNHKWGYNTVDFN